MVYFRIMVNITTGYRLRKRGSLFWRIGPNLLFVSPQVSIIWPDQHTSVFDADWLKKRCFSPAARQAVQEEYFLNGES